MNWSQSSQEVQMKHVILPQEYYQKLYEEIKCNNYNSSFLKDQKKDIYYEHYEYFLTRIKNENNLKMAYFFDYNIIESEDLKTYIQNVENKLIQDTLHHPFEPLYDNKAN